MTTLLGPAISAPRRPALVDRVLAGAQTGHDYTLRLASGMDDVRAAQMLRFKVFNLELNEGLTASYSTGFDADRFDAVCDHLLVTTVMTGEVIGTYRLQTGAQAAAN
ncbi:MAG: GNAT family N-acetyltransferase, partial [Verrucomicrobiota bacterium]